MLLSSKADLQGKSLANEMTARKKIRIWETSSSSSSSSLALLSYLSKREHLKDGLSPTDLVYRRNRFTMSKTDKIQN